MNLLSAVLPGFRALRPPIVAGFLWISNAIVFILVNHVKIPMDQPAFNTFTKLFPGWINLTAIPVAATVAYLVGSVMVGLTDPIVLAIESLYRHLVQKLHLP